MPVPSRSRFRTAALAALLAVLVALVPSASAQLLTDIVDELDRTGRYLEVDLEPVALEAVDRANAAGIAFARLDQEGDDVRAVADQLVDGLAAEGSRYDNLIVLANGSAFVVGSSPDAALAADRALDDFALGAVAAGIDEVVATLGGSAGSAGGGDTQGSTADDATDDGAADDGAAEAAAPAPESSGGGVPWFWILVLGVIVFFGMRWWLGRRRRDTALAAELEEDRAEIREQLRNNADHVIELGDRIADADDELRRMYEEAAQAYQDVSMGLDDATTAAEIDALDDRIDRAEWQFQVIEARLDGRTPPPEPVEPPPPGAPSTTPPPPSGRSTRPDGRQPVPPLGRERRSDGPALGDDESVFPGGPHSTDRRSTGRSRSRSGGGLGGMVGGLARSGLLALVMKMLLGGGLSLGQTSRRTQRRHTGRGGNTGLGGGVLR